MTEEEKNELYKKAFEITCNTNIKIYNTNIAVFEKVKETLNKNTIGQIENSKRDKVILISNSDNELAKGIVSYIWYKYPPRLVNGETGCKAYRVSLRQRDYSGWTEEQIVSDISHWGLSLKEVFLGTHDHKYKWDYMQFLQNVKGEYQEVLKRLLALARVPGGFKLGNERMLIVSTDKVDNLPKELESQFEVIKLEPEKQDTAQVAIELKYDKDRHILFTNGKYLQLTGDKKILIEYLFEGKKSIDLLRDKIAQSKGKSNKQYVTGNCRKLITKTNKVIEKEFSTKDFIRNEKNKSGFYCLTLRPKEGVFKGNIEVIQR